MGLPGGHIERGQDPREALVSEVRQEAGIPVTVDQLLDIYPIKAHGIVQLVFACSASSCDIRVTIESLEGQKGECARNARAAVALRRLVTRRRLNKKARKPVEACADYLTKHKDCLRYDEYLRDGLPIATGVIEGACRYLVRDRIEITGATWKLNGAEAVLPTLRLRSLVASGDFDKY